MMSQTSSNVDANVNPGYAEIHIEKCTDDDVGYWTAGSIGLLKTLSVPSNR